MYVNLSASQLRSEAGEYLGVVVVFEDVTSEVLMKEEVERVSKLAETGQLAANIAHELRNPLSSIKGAAQLLRNELPGDTVAQHGEFLDIIIEEVNGLNRITTEFLEFSRQTPPEMKPVVLNATLTRLLQFMGAGLQKVGVSIAYALGDDLPDVMMDKAQIEQVVKNIIINAAQAMPRGGYITVSTRYFPATDIVEMAFTDTGVGIPPEKQEKIFAPFFTTKTKGTGLGLAIARKIVETHGGKLTARSTPGMGSTFTLHLPTRPPHPHRMPPARLEIAEQRSDAAGGLHSLSAADRLKAHSLNTVKERYKLMAVTLAPAKADAKKTGPKTLFIADDEPNIRRVLQAIFQKDGYEVHVAENGVRALEVAAACPGGRADHGPDHAGHERRGTAAKDQAAAPRRGRHHDHGLRDHQNMRGRDALRGVGLHHQAVRHGRDPGGGQAGRRPRRRGEGGRRNADQEAAPSPWRARPPRPCARCMRWCAARRPPRRPS